MTTNTHTLNAPAYGLTRGTEAAMLAATEHITPGSIREATRRRLADYLKTGNLAALRPEDLGLVIATGRRATGHAIETGTLEGEGDGCHCWHCLHRHDRQAG